MFKNYRLILLGLIILLISCNTVSTEPLDLEYEFYVQNCSSDTVEVNISHFKWEYLAARSNDTISSVHIVAPNHTICLCEYFDPLDPNMIQPVPSDLLISFYVMSLEGDTLYCGSSIDDGMWEVSYRLDYLHNTKYLFVYGSDKK
jgi:hypothetical protein